MQYTKSNLTIGPEVWVAGKGPSLDTFDWSRAGEDRIGINETAFLVPKCRFAIAYDYAVLDKYKVTLPKDVIVFRKKTHVNYSFENEYVWLNEVRDRIATAPILIQILTFLGVTKIHFIGFDSINPQSPLYSRGYSSRILAIGARGANTDGYRVINRSILALISKLGIEAIWEHLHA